jgi:putative ATPase
MTDNHLFSQNKNTLPPLAVRMRPSRISELVGQEHLTGEDSILNRLLQSREIFSLILWGPPGTGKTTLARIVAETAGADFHEISAVTAGVKDVRELILKGENNLSQGRKTLLFIDEIHRFNKAQQDALLHAVENGSLVLIGATTENPSFEVISPLLSRMRILRLNSLSHADQKTILKRALAVDILLSKFHIDLQENDTDFLIRTAGGDARKMFNTLEICFKMSLSRQKTGKSLTINRSDIETALQEKNLLYDKTGDYHYDTISAFIKSVRGSDPDAAVYWMVVMLEGGEDPLFIARRLIILASEDVGNAEPSGLNMAVSGFQAVHAVGMPEAAIILAQVTTFLAAAPKSNASYLSLKRSREFIRQTGFQNVPLHLRNAPTSMMKEMKYGEGYHYPHDSGGFIKQNYLPEQHAELPVYNPVENGYEKYIRQRLKHLWPERFDSTS